MSLLGCYKTSIRTSKEDSFSKQVLSAIPGLSTADRGIIYYFKNSHKSVSD